MGMQGLVFNVQHSNPSTYDIADLEEMDVIRARNLEVTNAIAYKLDAVYYDSEYYTNTVDIIYPIFSANQFDRYMETNSINIKVMLRLNEQPNSCLMDQSCYPADSTVLKGVAHLLSDEEKFAFYGMEMDDVGLDENVILLELGKEPIDWYWNLAMFVVGSVFGFTILKSFFRRASSPSEYWYKVTEKGER